MPIKLNVGDIVEIDGKFYIVNSLIGCVDWDWKQGEYYLHNLNGSNFYSYPTSLGQLMLQIKESEGKVYPKTQFKINLELK